MNNLKTVFLLTLLTLLAIGVGDYFGGQNGMILGFVILGFASMGNASCAAARYARAPFEAHF